MSLSQIANGGLSMQSIGLAPFKYLLYIDTAHSQTKLLIYLLLNKKVISFPSSFISPLNSLFFICVQGS